MSFVGFGGNALTRAGRVAAATAMVFFLASCEDGTNFKDFNPFKKKEVAEGQAPAKKAARGGKTVERDVEAPDVFQAEEAGLWDGRPSLGGVWVAHPDVTDPERVIIRNTANNKFVIGALFRRERENPGPRLQVSSDAAETLGMLAGQPVKLNVTALRREEQVVEPAPDTALDAKLAAPAEVKQTKLDPISGAAAAIDAAEKNAQTTAAAAASKPVAAPKPKPKPAARKTSGLSKPYLQIGIFSVEKNANNTATAMRQAGMIPTVKKQKSKGKTFWRVLVGPATTSAERSELLKKIKASGFTDAYAVTN